MADGDDFSARQFGASFKGFLDRMAQQAPSEEPPFLTRLRAHFGGDPTALPIVGETFDRNEHANLHLAVEGLAKARNQSFELLGISAENDYFGIKLAHLLKTGGGLMGRTGVAQGPVQYRNVPIGDDQVLACVQSGLYLVAGETARLAMLVSGPKEMGFNGQVTVEVMGADRPTVDAALATIRNSMRKTNVYRGRVVSLRSNPHGQVQVDFHHLPRIGREDIILPEGLLARVERLTVKFSEHREKLAAARRHLKRGLLLYGPPGTGKTLTAMYLAGRMPERTTILLTGGGMGLIEQSCAMARTLQPATVILEDVDLVAEERTVQQKACNVVLFELLNQMDGLADDADLLFVLTTNRPEMLEAALASRPGRIDQAIEIPLPDPACRQRLLSLYAAGLTLEVKDQTKIIERTEGTSAAFIRELLRKAALFAADDGAAGPIVVRDKHFEEALYEMVVLGGAMNKSLLGFAPPANP